jgi:hypothetical protein
MDYEECEFAVGNGTQIEYYTEPITNDDSDIPAKYNIKVGGVYYLDVSQLSQDDLNAAWRSMVINKTPCFIIFCNSGCGICKKFVKNVLKSKNFIDWLSEYKKCAVVYLNAYHNIDNRFYFLYPE